MLKKLVFTAALVVGFVTSLRIAEAGVAPSVAMCDNDSDPFGCPQRKLP